ncbi:MAG: hypothetical protein HGA51_00060 [Demequinaceae bacterium]|nr:hypothetical protein [Demequinaceae bacterium]
MLNSKYAPVVAITIVLILIIGAVGFLLGVKPQVNAAAHAAARQDVVKANIDQINKESAQIDKAAAILANAPDLSEATDLNAPSSMKLPEFQTRLDAAIKASGAEQVSLSVGAPVAVVPWTVGDAALPSAGVASYFATQPVVREANEKQRDTPYVPVGGASVAVATTDEASADGGTPAPAPAQTAEEADVEAVATITRMDVTLTVVGHPAEVDALLRGLADPTQRLFQVFALSDEGKQARDTAEKGAGPYVDGDVFAVITGALYLLNPDYSIVDEEATGPFQLPPLSAFVEPADFEPQVGSSR